MKAYRGSGGMAPHILNLGARWTWVVSLTHRLLYTRERVASTHSIRGCVSPKTRLRDLGKRYLALAGIQSPTRPARSLFGTMSALSWLPQRRILQMCMASYIVNTIHSGH